MEYLIANMCCNLHSFPGLYACERMERNLQSLSLFLVILCFIWQFKQEAVLAGAVVTPHILFITVEALTQAATFIHLSLCKTSDRAASN
jgi:diacylglycerol kinase